MFTKVQRLQAQARVPLHVGRISNLEEYMSHMKHSLAYKIGEELIKHIEAGAINVSIEEDDRFHSGFKSQVFTLDLVVASTKDIEKEIERRVDELLKHKCNDTLTQVEKILKC